MDSTGFSNGFFLVNLMSAKHFLSSLRRHSPVTSQMSSSHAPHPSGRTHHGLTGTISVSKKLTH